MNIPQFPESKLSPELVVELDKVERDYWVRLWRNIPLHEQNNLGLHLEQVEDAIALVCDKVPDWLLNRVLGMGMTTEASTRDVHYFMGLYRNKHLPFAIALSPFAHPPRLANEIEDLGFENVLDWAKMVRGNQPPDKVDTELRVEKVSPEQYEHVTSLMLAGFGMPDMLRPIFASAVSAQENTTFMAWQDDKPVAAAIITITGKIGHMNTACTLVESRGQHAHKALLAKRIEEGLLCGCELFVAESGILPDEANPSLQNLVRAGFEMAYRRPNYVLKPS